MLKIPEKYSNSNIWIAYYLALKEEFGEKNAKNLFYYAWKERSNDILLNDTIFTSFLFANDLKIGKFAKEVSSTSSGVNPLVVAGAIIGTGLFVFYLTTVFRATNIVLGFAKQIKPKDVVDTTKNVADIKSGGFTKFFKK